MALQHDIVAREPDEVTADQGLGDLLDDREGHGLVDRGGGAELGPLSAPSVVRLELLAIHADGALGGTDDVADARVQEELGRVLDHALDGDHGADGGVRPHDVRDDRVLRGVEAAGHALLDGGGADPGGDLGRLRCRAALGGGAARAAVAVREGAGVGGVVRCSLQGTLLVEFHASPTTVKLANISRILKKEQLVPAWHELEPYSGATGDDSAIDPRVAHSR